MSADFVESASFSEGEVAVEVVFTEKPQPGGVEAVELAEGKDVVGLGDHEFTLVRLVAYGNYRL